MNKELLMKIHDVMECEGDVRMGMWASGSKVTKCGTVGCIAGWAMIMNGDMTKKGDLRKAIEKDLVERCEDPWNPEEARGKELLGLTDDQANKLFFVGNWPADLSERYYQVDEHDGHDGAAAREARVKITQERIRRFIESGGRQ